MLLYQPQLPRPVELKQVTKWSDITVTADQLAKQDRGLRQYLQNYLTKVWQALVPTHFTTNVLNAGLLPYTVNGTDQFVATPSGTVNLPQAGGSGRLITIKNIDPADGPVTITAFGTDTIDGQPNYVLAPQYQVLQLIDGAVGQWFIW